MVGSVVRNASQPLLASFADGDGERFFMPLIACIVTQRARVSKSFLCRPQLRNWGTEKKKRHDASKD